MTQESNALRLAELFESSYYDETLAPRKAAAELRRLHADTEYMVELVKKLVAQRDALLEALKWIADVNATDYEYQAKARAAIAKAEENT